MNDSPGRNSRRSGVLVWGLVFLIVCAFIIIPFLIAGEVVEETVIRLIDDSDDHSLLVGGVLFVLLALDVVLTTPSSIISTVLGARFGILGGTAIGFVAMTISCWIGYLLGKTVRGTTAGRLISEKHIAQLHQFSERFGTWSLVILRPVPVLAEASTIFAGLGAMPFGRYMLVTGAANFGISLGYSCVGALATDWNSFLLAFLGALLIPGVLLGVARHMHREEARSTD